MAILRQQQHFIDQLYTSGMVDETEREMLVAPIQRQERRLTRRGPHWRAPSISEVRLSLLTTAADDKAWHCLGNSVVTLYEALGI